MPQDVPSTRSQSRQPGAWPGHNPREGRIAEQVEVERARIRSPILGKCTATCCHATSEEDKRSILQLIVSSLGELR